MGNYTIFYMFGNLGQVRASKKFYSKCFENSRSQIIIWTDIFQKLTLGAPEIECPFPNFLLSLTNTLYSISFEHKMEGEAKEMEKGDGYYKDIIQTKYLL